MSNQKPLQLRTTDVICVLGRNSRCVSIQQQAISVEQEEKLGGLNEPLITAIAWHATLHCALGKCRSV